MKDFELTYHRFSERSILVQWPHKIDDNLLKDVLFFKNQLLNSNNESILYVNSAYNSILVIYEYTIDNINDEFLLLEALYLDRVSIKKRALRHWKIPVCYDDKFGIDLDEISSKNELPKQEIIKLHSNTIYTVFFSGFLPGFLYLGGLDERLFFPRKSTPRLQVKKGAVAIGNMQTGIYPNSSPAGWNIIGNSPLNFFDISKTKPCFAEAGDKIEFITVSIQRYKEISNAVKNGTYHIESKIIDD